MILHHAFHLQNWHKNKETIVKLQKSTNAQTCFNACKKLKASKFYEKNNIKLFHSAKVSHIMNMIKSTMNKKYQHAIVTLYIYNSGLIYIIRKL